MPDDTSAAIQALIQQVQTLTETVTTQQSNLDGIAKQNKRLLDKVQDQKRTDTNQNLMDAVDRKADQQRMADAGFVQDADGWRLPKSDTSDGAVVITREEARDAAAYQAAKQRASDLGVECPGSALMGPIRLI